MEYEELIKEIAEEIIPIMNLIDLFLVKFEIKDIDKIIENMQDHDSYLAAFPFPETMRKAEVMNVKTETFRKFRDLLKARTAQTEVMKKSDITPGGEILKLMGMA
jgi:hypothetical protein